MSKWKTKEPELAGAVARHLARAGWSLHLAVNLIRKREDSCLKALRPGLLDMLSDVFDLRGVVAMYGKGVGAHMREYHKPVPYFAKPTKRRTTKPKGASK